eukprot:4112154-Amphidinium_carterae.1
MPRHLLLNLTNLQKQQQAGLASCTMSGSARLGFSPFFTMNSPSSCVRMWATPVHQVSHMRNLPTIPR